jgi:hypothetical protein
MTDEAQAEYDAALVAFKAAQKRLTAAKQHAPLSGRDLRLQKVGDEKRAEHNAKARARRAARRAERLSPENQAKRAAWEQSLANIGQDAIERLENMPDDLRILTRANP